MERVVCFLEKAVDDDCMFEAKALASRIGGGSHREDDRVEKILIGDGEDKTVGSDGINSAVDTVSNN